MQIDVNGNGKNFGTSVQVTNSEDSNVIVMVTEGVSQMTGSEFSLRQAIVSCIQIDGSEQ